MHKLDLFGNKINLNLNKHEKIKTRLGGFLTIITMLIVLFFSWLIGEDLIFRKKPFTNQYKQPLDSTLNITFPNSSEFFFAFGIQDFYGKNMNISNYFELEVFTTQIEFNQNNMSESVLLEEQVEIDLCQLEQINDAKKLYLDQATLNYLSGMFCMQFKNLNIHGSWSESSISYFTIRLKKCSDSNGNRIKLKNESEINYYNNNNFNFDFKKKENCKSDSEIQEFLSSNDISFNIFYLSNSILLEDYENPIKYYLKNIYYYFQLGSLKYVYLSAQNNSIITNDAAIFNNADEKFFYSIQEEKIDSFTSNQTLFALEFYSSNIFSIYNRRYIKITEILASLGGFLKIFAMLFFEINRKFAFFKKNEYIIKRTFSLFREGEYDVDKINVNSVNDKFEKFCKKEAASQPKFRDLSAIQRKDTFFDFYSEKRFTNLFASPKLIGNKDNDFVINNCDENFNVDNTNDFNNFNYSSNKNRNNLCLNNNDNNKVERRNKKSNFGNNNKKVALIEEGLEENVLEYLKDDSYDSRILRLKENETFLQKVNKKNSNNDNILKNENNNDNKDAKDFTDTKINKVKSSKKKKINNYLENKNGKPENNLNKINNKYNNCSYELISEFNEFNKQANSHKKRITQVKTVESESEDENISDGEIRFKKSEKKLNKKDSNYLKENQIKAEKKSSRILNKLELKCKSIENSYLAESSNKCIKKLPKEKDLNFSDNLIESKRERLRFKIDSLEENDENLNNKSAENNSCNVLEQIINDPKIINSNINNNNFDNSYVKSNIKLSKNSNSGKIKNQQIKYQSENSNDSIKGDSYEIINSPVSKITEEIERNSENLLKQSKTTNTPRNNINNSNNNNNNYFNFKNLETGFSKKISNNLIPDSPNRLYYSTLFRETYGNQENMKILKKKILLRTKDLKINMHFTDVFNYYYIKFNCKKFFKKRNHKEIEIKHKLFNIASERISEYCDIAKIIKFQNYFNNFEKVVLNENQLKAVKLMEKPVLTSDSSYIRSQTQIERNFIDQIIEYLEECSKKKEIDPVDFDENIIKLICY